MLVGIALAAALDVDRRGYAQRLGPRSGADDESRTAVGALRANAIDSVEAMEGREIPDRGAFGNAGVLGCARVFMAERDGAAQYFVFGKPQVCLHNLVEPGERRLRAGMQPLPARRARHRVRAPRLHVVPARRTCRHAQDMFDRFLRHRCRQEPAHRLA